MRNIWIAGVVALSLPLSGGTALAEFIYGNAVAVDGDTLDRQWDQDPTFRHRYAGSRTNLSGGGRVRMGLRPRG